MQEAHYCFRMTNIRTSINFGVMAIIIIKLLTSLTVVANLKKSFDVLLLHLLSTGPKRNNPTNADRPSGIIIAIVQR